MSRSQFDPPGSAFRSRKPPSFLQENQGIPRRIPEAKVVFVGTLAGCDATMRLNCLRPFGSIVRQGAGRSEPSDKRGKAIFRAEHEPEHAQEVDEIGFSRAIRSNQKRPLAKLDPLAFDGAKTSQIQPSQPRGYA